MVYANKNTELDSDVVFYPFSPGIPWNAKSGIIEPYISHDIWLELIKPKECNVVCPGFFLEVLLLPLFSKVLERHSVKVDKWIVPSYYNDFLNLFGITTASSVSGRSITVFTEFDRLFRTVRDYPAPVFMDRMGKVYFNCLFNYGEKVDPNGDFVDRDYEPFWRQVLKNTCCHPYEISFPTVERDFLRTVLEKLLVRYGADPDKPYFIVDNMVRSYRTADYRVAIDEQLTLPNVNTLGSVLSSYKHQCVVMADGVQQYKMHNVFSLPPWYKMSSLEFFALLLFAGGIYSSDPNVYMSGAILGCSRIVAVGNFDSGWELKDALEISCAVDKRRKWQQRDDFDLNSVLKVLVQ